MGDLNTVLRQMGQLQLTEKSAIQLEKREPDYVLDIAVQTSEDPLVAAACSNHNIRLLVRDRLTATSSLTGHTSNVTGIVFGKTDPNVLFSCSKDKSIICWDIRTKEKAQAIDAPTSVTGDLLCVDIAQSDNLLCTGSEKVGEDALVLFWDRRQCKLLGSYKECHEDDITQVRFQPSSDRYLATGSADGLLCTFDLSQTSEDDALQTTSNAQSAISKIGWCGESNSCVYCVTTDNMFFSWDGLEGDDCCSIENLNDLLEGESSVEYLVDCIPELTSCGDRTAAVLVAGTNNGTIQLISHNSNSTSVFTSLKGGHEATVRCCHWDTKKKTLLSGGEDSLLCLWSVDSVVKNTSTTPRAKDKAKLTPKGRKPYSKKKKS